MNSITKLDPTEGMLATIVLYQKTIDESTTLQSLVGCMERTGRPMDILVYDNSHLPQGPSNLFSDEKRFFYIHDPSNSGVSKAYNTGFQMAKRLGKTWLLLLDQDTEFPADALERYSSAMSGNKTAVLLAPILTCKGKIYSPCGHVAHVGFPLKRVTPGIRSATWKSLLNSGMCVNIDAFEKVGGFDERIPLDFADHDFIRRYKKHFDSFVVIDVVCRHNFSDKESGEIEPSLARFSHYCRGARTYATGVCDAFSVLPIVFLRALRLSMRYRSIRYLMLLFHTSAKRSPQHRSSKNVF